jgi:AraC family transcriptional regulator
MIYKQIKENIMKNQDITIKKLEEKKVAFVSFTGNYMGNPQIFADLFTKLFEWAMPKGLISEKSVFLSSYQDDPNITPPDELKLEVCMSIPDGAEVAGDVQKKVLPGGKYAVMNTELTGPEEYGPAWNAVVEWIVKNNYEIDMSRPSYEIYLNNPEEHPEKHHIIDICMSVKGN